MSVEDNGSTGEIDIGMKVRSMIDKSGDWLDHVRHHDCSSISAYIYQSFASFDLLTWRNKHLLL